MLTGLASPDGASRRVLIASNRGPVSFVRDEAGKVVPKRGMGGLVTALTGALHAIDGLWIAAAMTEDDASKAGARFDVELGTSRYTLRYLAFEPRTYAGYYDQISNRILWFVHHMLWDVPRAPTFRGLAADWDRYRAVNEAFAVALAEEGGDSGARYLVQDYHLSLVPAMLRRARSAAKIAHFSHIPFAGPDTFGILPGWVREEILAGMLGADVVGFHAPAWADHFLMCCQSLPGARADLRRRRVRWEGREVRVGVYPISVDPDRLRLEASSAEVARARRALTRTQGDRKLLVRVDRAELSKNILRGLLAFEALLETQPDRRNAVTFVAHLAPTRQRIPEYRSYISECVATAERINRRWGRSDWKPIRMSLKDDLAAALASYQLYDALLVNPVVDGMNLVAKEGPMLNERDGVLILSETAGAFPELGQHAIPVNPFDVDGTAHAIGLALDLDPVDRRGRLRGLRAAVARNPIGRWVDAQLADLDGTGP
jgi:trehalose 6-phosphate synthase